MNTSTNGAGYEQDHALQYVYVGLCQHVSLSVFPETFYETLHAMALKDERVRESHQKSL